MEETVCINKSVYSPKQRNVSKDKWGFTYRKQERVWSHRAHPLILYGNMPMRHFLNTNK